MRNIGAEFQRQRNVIAIIIEHGQVEQGLDPLKKDGVGTQGRAGQEHRVRAQADLRWARGPGRLLQPGLQVIEQRRARHMWWHMRRQGVGQLMAQFHHHA